MKVTRTYLELTSPEQLRPAGAPPAAAVIERVEVCPPAFYRYLYAEVGKEWHWVDRLDWDDEQIRSHLARPSVTLWVLWIGGEPAGWFELKRHDDGSVEIAYFGILPAYRRRGLGKHLLSEAVRRAWAAGGTRVWLHTCTLDDPAALPNYVARGFQAYKEESYELDL
jgi:ribosomal protein S18 acetylase RimI-like enzyme